MSKELFILLIVAGLSLQHFTEAWLEDIVILLKDPKLAYGDLDDKEHARSLVFAIIAASPYGILAINQGFYWLLGALFVNRRLVFDPALKHFRKRKLRVYERKKGVDAFMARLFGINGALKEIALEAAATAGFIILQIVY